MTASRGLDEDRDRALSASAGKIDRDCIDAATLEADDIGLHRCGVARCAVTEDNAHQFSSAERCCFNHSGEIFTSMRRCRQRTTLFAFLARDVLMVFRKVERHRECAHSKHFTGHRTKKILAIS